MTVVTGDLDNAGTKATVSLYVCGEARQSGPIILGSGKHQLFNPNSTGIFRIKLIHCNLLAKIYYDILSLKKSREFFVCFGIAFILHFLGKYRIFYPKGVEKQE